MKMKNIITLRDYIQQAEKSHSLERKQIIDLLDSNNPEILHQLCLAAGRCRRRWLFHETQLVCFFDFGEEAPDADGTERLILKAENAGFSKIILKRKQGDDFQTALWQHIANRCRQRRMQLILSLDKFNLTDISRLKDSGVYGFRCEAGTFNERIYRRIHKSKTSGNFSYLLKCLENIHDCGADLTIGFAVGITGTTTSDIASDILYLPQLRPHNVEICRFSPEVDETLALKSIALVRLLNPRVTLTASPVLCNLPEAPFLEQLLAGADTVATSVMLPSMLSEICFHIKTCGFTVNRDFEK